MILFLFVLPASINMLYKQLWMMVKLTKFNSTLQYLGPLNRGVLKQFIGCAKYFHSKITESYKCWNHVVKCLKVKKSVFFFLQLFTSAAYCVPSFRGGEEEEENCAHQWSIRVTKVVLLSQKWKHFVILLYYNNKSMTSRWPSILCNRYFLAWL